jgi:hypothetical protein
MIPGMAAHAHAVMLQEKHADQRQRKEPTMTLPMTGPPRAVQPQRQRRFVRAATGTLLAVAVVAGLGAWQRSGTGSVTGERPYASRAGETMPMLSDQERYQHWLPVMSTSTVALEPAAHSDHELYGRWLQAHGVVAP